MREIEIVLPLPPRELSPNARVCWAVKAKAAKLAKVEAKTTVKNALAERGLSALGFRPSCYNVVWVYKGRKPDADNVLASCKAFLDGIADALGIDDRDLECGGISRTHYMAYQHDEEIGVMEPQVAFVIYGNESEK